MAKGYKENEQAFGQGDIAILDNEYRVKVLNVFEEEDGSYWYEVEGTELLPAFKAITREVPQLRLEAV